MNIFIEVNNYCELKCRFCIADLGYKYPSTNISTELIDEIINTYQNDKHKAVFITGGEPLLHPKIADIIRNFAINGYYTYITTNGQKFSDEEFAVNFMYSGVENSFNVLKKGLDNIFYIKKYYMPHIKIELRLLMAKYNIKHNIETIEWIHQNYPEVDYISILGLQLSSRTNNYEHMIEISMTEAAPYLLSCLVKLREYGIPLCVLGEEFSDFYCKNSKPTAYKIEMFPHLSVQPHIKKLADCVYREESSKQKSVDICKKCRYLSTCEGIQERYIKKYGFEDLKAIL